MMTTHPPPDKVALPPLRTIIKTHGLGARKSLGQHFLLDLNITRKIARVGSFDSADTIIEVGPGPGGLTRALLETGARVIAIERDRRCIDALQELEQAYPDRLFLIEGDALKISEQPIIASLALDVQRVHIVSNLPYNISTELLIKWLKVHPPFWTSLTLMFQKEVGDRITSLPGCKSFGRLSILCQALCETRKILDLPAQAFTPPPKVASCVVHFTPRRTLDVSIENLERVTQAAFSQRRKMLRTSLKPIFGPHTPTMLSQLGIPETARAEELSITRFIELAKALS